MSINWRNRSSSSPAPLVLQPMANAWLWDKQLSSHQQVSDRRATIRQRIDRRIIPERLCQRICRWVSGASSTARFSRIPSDHYLVPLLKTSISGCNKGLQGLRLRNGNVWCPPVRVKSESERHFVASMAARSRCDVTPPSFHWALIVKDRTHFSAPRLSSGRFFCRRWK